MGNKAFGVLALLFAVTTLIAASSPPAGCDSCTMTRDAISGPTIRDHFSCAGECDSCTNCCEFVDQPVEGGDKWGATCKCGQFDAVTGCDAAIIFWWENLVLHVEYVCQQATNCCPTPSVCTSPVTVGASSQVCKCGS